MWISSKVILVFGLASRRQNRKQWRFGKVHFGHTKPRSCSKPDSSFDDYCPLRHHLDFSSMKKNGNKKVRRRLK
ncbi:unnamed protein product [Linum trigynum]|uniref:Uncharacterized protein n=1 Tax=Linum trigynum TaxID=586398 RepID=A0AAV2FJV1_9ROSI